MHLSIVFDTINEAAEWLDSLDNSFDATTIIEAVNETADIVTKEDKERR